MRMMIGIVALVALSACGSKPTETAETSTSGTATTASTTASSASAAPSSFAQCAVCHKVTKDGGNGVGPNLHSVIGKKAGQIAGFNYSPSMKDSGLVWDEATLDKFLTNPRDLVGGTRMSFAGQSDPAKRKEIIDWLKKN